MNLLMECTFKPKYIEMNHFRAKKIILIKSETTEDPNSSNDIIGFVRNGFQSPEKSYFRSKHLYSLVRKESVTQSK